MQKIPDTDKQNPVICLSGNKNIGWNGPKKTALRSFSFERAGGPPPSVFFALSGIFLYFSACAEKFWQLLVSDIQYVRLSSVPFGTTLFSHSPTCRFRRKILFPQNLMQICQLFFIYLNTQTAECLKNTFYRFFFIKKNAFLLKINQNNWHFYKDTPRKKAVRMQNMKILSNLKKT